LALLRPNLLRRSKSELPTLIIDGAVRSDLSGALRALSVHGIAAVRRLSAAQAAQRYAVNQSNAVIEVLTALTRESDGSSGLAGCA
jgi:hypothetical protein